MNRHVMDNLQVFKSTYQKPSRIYKYLSERQKAHPLFLQRTLSYVNKYRAQRVIRRDTSIDSVAKRLKNNLRKDNIKAARNPSDHMNGASGNVSKERKRAKNHPPVRIIFNWICDDPEKTSQKTKSYSFTCPWCELEYHHLDSLMIHLKCCHPRFNFNLVEEDDLPLIEMSLNESFDGSYCGFKYPGHDLKRDFKFTPSSRQRRAPQTQIIHFKSRRRTNTLTSFRQHNSLCNGYFASNDDDEIDVDVCSGRLYYHTSTCLPIKPNEGDIDSEADMDPDWLKERTQLMIDEFTDVNEGEKEILKRWNLHIMSNRYKSDGTILQACLDFVEKERSTISKKLPKNFVLHLVNLHDYGLISSGDMLECIRKLRRPAASSPARVSIKNKLERKDSGHGLHSPPAKRAAY